MGRIKTLASFLIFACFLPAQNSTVPEPSKSPDASRPNLDKHALQVLTAYEVNGTRFPASSIIRLTGLQVGQMVNFDMLGDLSNKITSTGLVSAVKCAYNVDPAKPGVMISLTISDEVPLLPVRIEPAGRADEIWACLQSADPIFTPQMPNTTGALAFYSANINRCLNNSGQPNQHAASRVLCGVDAKPAEIVFFIRQGPPPSASR